MAFQNYSFSIQFLPFKKTQLANQPAALMHQRISDRRKTSSAENAEQSHQILTLSKPLLLARSWSAIKKCQMMALLQALLSGRQASAGLLQDAQL